MSVPRSLDKGPAEIEIGLGQGLVTLSGSGDGKGYECSAAYRFIVTDFPAVSLYALC